MGKAFQQQYAQNSGPKTSLGPSLTQLSGTEHSVKPMSVMHIATNMRGGNNQDKFSGSVSSSSLGQRKKGK